MSKHIKASLIKSGHDSGYGTLIKTSLTDASVKGCNTLDHALIFSH